LREVFVLGKKGPREYPVLKATPGAGFHGVWSASCTADAGNPNQSTVTPSESTHCSVRFWSNDRIFADGLEDVPPL